jgi:hypothetical protein
MKEFLFFKTKFYFKNGFWELNNKSWSLYLFTDYSYASIIKINEFCKESARPVLFIAVLVVEMRIDPEQFARSSWVMPTPVSVTEISWASDFSWLVIVILPVGLVNLICFEIRFYMPYHIFIKKANVWLNWIRPDIFSLRRRQEGRYFWLKLVYPLQG